MEMRLRKPLNAVIGRFAERNDCTKEETALVALFLKHEEDRGIRNVEKLVHPLTPFVRYLHETSIDMLYVKSAQAAEYQTSLVTRTDAEGSPWYASCTVTTLMSIAGRMYEALRNENIISTNPFRGIVRHRVGRTLPSGIPDEETMAAVLESLARFGDQRTLTLRRQYYKSHVMAELMYATGLRIREVLDLTEEDIDLYRKLVTVRSGKGGCERTAFLSDYAAEVLSHYIHSMRDVVVVNRNARTLFGVTSRSTVSATFHTVLAREAKKHGIAKFTSHSFRHTLGFHLLKRGCDMRYIQLILGHKDMNTTTIYTRVAKEDLKNQLDTCHPRQWGPRDPS